MLPQCVHAKIIITSAVVYAEWVLIASLGQRRRCGKIKNSNITCTSRLHSCQQTQGLKWGTRYYSPSVDALRIIPDKSVLHCITSISDLDKKNRHNVGRKQTLPLAIARYQHSLSVNDGTCNDFGVYALWKHWWRTSFALFWRNMWLRQEKQV